MAEPEPNERIAAALAHGLIIANWMGVIAAALIWLLEKERSKYVALQALQAVAYQFMGLLVWMAGLFLYIFALFGGLGLVALLNPKGEGGGIVALLSLGPLCLLFLLSLRDPVPSHRDPEGWDTVSVRMGPVYPLWPIWGLCHTFGPRFSLSHPGLLGGEVSVRGAMNTPLTRSNSHQ